MQNKKICLFWASQTANRYVLGKEGHYQQGGVDVQQIRDHAFCDHVKKHPYGRS